MPSKCVIWLGYLHINPPEGCTTDVVAVVETLFDDTALVDPTVLVTLLDIDLVATTEIELVFEVATTSPLTEVDLIPPSVVVTGLLLSSFGVVEN